MKKLDMPTALVVVALLAAFVVLTIVHADATIILGLLLGALGVGGAQQLGKIYQQTNGNLGLIEELRASRQAHHELALTLAGKQPAVMDGEPRSPAPVGDALGPPEG